MNVWHSANWPEDWGKRARFCDGLEGDWVHHDLLCGLRKSDGRYIDSCGNRWRYCEVMDDEPKRECSVDPGEGWRLIQPGEEYQWGDEYLSREGWTPRTILGMHEKNHIPQRRRTHRPYTFHELVQAVASGQDETNYGYIVGLNEREVTFKRNDISETRTLSDCSDVTWADGSPFGVKQ